MADVEYKIDFRDTGRLMRGAAMHVAMIDIAFDAIEFAKGISPDAPPYGEGYIDSFEVDGGKYERVGRTKRAAAHLVNTSEHAAAVEWGNEHIRPHYVLSFTADIIESGF